MLGEDARRSDLTLGLRYGRGDQVVKTETFKGPWALLHVISRGKDVAHDGSKWTVEYEVTDNGKPYSVWLQFDLKGLPDVKDWPRPPK